MVTPWFFVEDEKKSCSCKKAFDSMVLFQIWVHWQVMHFVGQHKYRQWVYETSFGIICHKSEYLCISQRVWKINWDLTNQI